MLSLEAPNIHGVFSATFQNNEPQQIAGSPRHQHTPCTSSLPSSHTFTSWEVSNSRPCDGNGWAQTGLCVQDGISRKNKRNSDAERWQTRTEELAIHLPFFCVYITNIGSQHLAANFIDKGSQSSSPFSKLSSTTTVLHHGPYLHPWSTATFSLHGVSPLASSMLSITNTTSLQNHSWC